MCDSVLHNADLVTVCHGRIMYGPTAYAVADEPPLQCLQRLRRMMDNACTAVTLRDRVRFICVARLSRQGSNGVFWHRETVCHYPQEHEASVHFSRMVVASGIVCITLRMFARRVGI